MNRTHGLAVRLRQLTIVIAATTVGLGSGLAQAQPKGGGSDPGTSAARRTSRILRLRDSFLRATLARPFLRRQMAKHDVAPEVLDDGDAADPPAIEVVADTPDKKKAVPDKKTKATPPAKKAKALAEDKAKAGADDKSKASVEDKGMPKPADKKHKDPDGEPASDDKDDPPVAVREAAAAPSAGGGLACVEALCAQLDADGCNTEDRVLSLARACAGNYTGDCVKTVCQRLGHEGCGTLEQAELVAQACAFNLSGDCLNTGCGYVGAADCGVSDISVILDACAGNLGDACVHHVCSHLGKVGCKTVDELTEVARACGRAY